MALRITDVGKRFGPTVALDGAAFEVAAGRGARPHRRERSGEEHAAQHPGRPAAARPRPHRGGRAPLRTGLAAGSARSRHRSHPPGALALSSPDRGRERAGGGRAAALAASSTAGRRAAAPRRCWPSSDTRTSTPMRQVGRLPIAARQVVEICRAVASRARVILMDEPTSSLQRQDVERLFALIRRLAGAGAAVVYISHFLEETREIAVGLHRAARRPLGRDGPARGRDQRRLDRADGRPHGERALSRARRGSRGSEAARGARPRGAARGEVGELRDPTAARSWARSASWARAARRWCGPSTAWPRPGKVPCVVRGRETRGGARHRFGAARRRHRLRERGPQGRRARPAHAGGRQRDPDPSFDLRPRPAS